jgi:hypothetical protein
MYNSRENRNNVEETRLQNNTWKQWIKAGLILAGAVGVYVASKAMSGIFSLISSFWQHKKFVDATAICTTETVQFGGSSIVNCDSWSRIISKLTPEIECAITPTEDGKALITWTAENEFGEKDYYGMCINYDNQENKNGSVFRIKKYEDENAYFCVKETIPNQEQESNSSDSSTPLLGTF